MSLWSRKDGYPLVRCFENPSYRANDTRISSRYRQLIAPQGAAVCPNYLNFALRFNRPIRTDKCYKHMGYLATYSRHYNINSSLRIECLVYIFTNLALLLSSFLLLLSYTFANCESFRLLLPLLSASLF